MLDPVRDRRRSWRGMTPGAALMVMTAIIVATVAARDAAVLGTANRYPELAVKLAPANATAITRVFDKLILTPEGLRRNLQGWVVASRQALRADPLNASGIRLLAYVTELTPGGLRRARQLMLLSERTSRRDILAQIWLIEDAVQRDDVASALHHYDRALSVRPAIAGQLFPVLVAAATEPTIQAGLVPYLRADRPWVASFLSVLIDKSPDPVAVAVLFRRYGGARAVPDHAGLETALLKRLVLTGNVRQARSLALSGGAGDALGAAGFTPGTIATRFRPLTWSLYEGGEGDVSLVPPDGLAITVPPETKIVAATRIIVPPSSGMMLRQRVSYPDRDEVPMVAWKAYCRRMAGPPEPFWTRDLPTVAAPTLVETPIDMPAHCTGVQIDVEATGAGGSTDSRVLIDRVELTTR